MTPCPRCNAPMADVCSRCAAADASNLADNPFATAPEPRPAPAPVVPRKRAAKLVPGPPWPLPAPPPPAPRPQAPGASGEGGGFRWMFVGAVRAGPAGLFLLWAAGSAGLPWSDRILDRRGRLVDATPTEVRATHYTANNRPMMAIGVTFPDGAGAPQKAEAKTADAELIARARQHEPIKIEYDPENPTVARVQGGKGSALPLWEWLALMVFFILPGLNTFRRGVFRTLQSWRLYRDGAVAKARVVDIERASSGRALVARYEFDIFSGRYTGELKSFHPPPCGSEIWIIYNPDRPEHNLAA